MKRRRDKIEAVKDELTGMQRMADIGYKSCGSLSEKDYLDLIGGIVVVIDAHQNIVLINKKGRETLECSDDNSYIGKNWFDIFIPERSRKEVRDCFDKLISGELKSVEYYENPVLTCKGKEKIIAWHNTILQDEEGNPIGALSSGIDITERMCIEEILRRSREELRISEARYRAIIQTQNEFLCRFLPDTTLTFVNEALCRYTNKKREDLIGRKLTDFIYKKDRGKVKRQISPLSLKNPTETHEERVIDIDGSIRWLEWTNSAIFNDKGEIVEYQSVGRDVTERKLAEDSLKESEGFLSDILSSIQDGISILDCDLNIIMVNKTMENWYSHAMPLVGKKCYEAYHGASEPCKVCPTRKTLETNKSYWEIVPKTGPDKKVEGWVDLYSFPFLDKSTGKLKGVIEYVRDATDRRQIEKEREALNKELIKSNRKLLRLALKDPQTGLYNHRYFEEIIESEFYRANRHARPLSLIMIDIDYFKSLNDAYGHQFADTVLIQFAKRLRRSVRLHDYVIRYGGEEFIVILQEIDRAGATTLARRILNSVRVCNFGNDKNIVKLKISLAVVSYPEDKANSSMDMVELADKILNNVKEEGGDKIGASMSIRSNKARKTKEGSVGYLRQKLNRVTKRANQSLIESIFAFAKTIELKDHFTGDHVEKTVHYVTEIARNLRLPEREILLIEQAAVLHDLGKIGISDEILLKNGKLTEEEFKNIKEHPKIGVDIIRPIQFLRGLIPLILHHHERWDGKGYPSGLKGEEIPLGARIIAIADVYQALMSDRPYRKALPREDAISILREGSGTQFDPKIVSTFLGIIGDARKDY